MAHWPACAHLGIGQLGRERLNVYEAWASSTVGGVVVGTAPGTGLSIEGAAVTQMLNDVPDTASFRARGFVPIAGQPIAVYGGAADLEHQLFGGRILETTVLYEGRKEHVAYDLRCIDPTWLMNRRKVLASYVNASATVIVFDLLARFSRGVTANHLTLGLPIVDAITFTNEDLPACLTAVCERIGGYWYLDYQGDLHVFLNEAINAQPITDADPRGSANHTLAEDLSQVVTRVIGRGGGVGAAVDLASGAVELPIDEGDAAGTWYAETGGLVEVNTQILSYTGVRGRGATGSVVGTGNAPTSAPTVKPAGDPASGLTPGATYKYAFTFKTATGETLPGPLASFVPSGAAGHQTAVRPARSMGAFYPGGTPAGGVVYFGLQAVYDGGVPAPVSSLCGPYLMDGYDWEINVGSEAIHPTTGFRYWPLLEADPPAPMIRYDRFRTLPGQTVLHRASGIAFRSPGWVGICSDFDSSIAGSPGPPAAGTLNAATVGVPFSSDPVVTHRRVYRTAANGSQLKFLGEISNASGSSSGYFDLKADAALGANAPTADTSGLVEKTGVVPVGSPDLIVADPGPFVADGGAGWVRVANMVIKYTGITAGKLSGIPAVGIGAITAPIKYGATVILQPRLIGIPSSGTNAITAPINKGDRVMLRIEREDTAAIAAFAARLGSSDPADGIVEEVFSDSRYTIAELTNYLQALLLDRKDPRRTVTFDSRDPALQVGQTITLAISVPPISGTFRIQRIGISQIAVGGLHTIPYPLRQVEATNKLYTFSDLLRQLRGREAGVP